MERPYCFITSASDSALVGVAAKQVEVRCILDSVIPPLSSWPLGTHVSALLGHLG